MELLKLIALDDEDLAVVSAHMQDAVVRLEDIAFLPGEHRFALVARRFDWEGANGEPPRRRLTGLHFDRVLRARCRGIDPARRDETLNLLAIAFEEMETPSGLVTLHFSDDRAVQLEVECIEAGMKDLGPVWEAEGRPDHATTDERA
ncbi:DUF2948 family protein [Salinarimonas soli]|uniref:DUF2948 family protein n=1 Tax=Salinarimonas soli TaxID=1638099 RepID=A0A5B2VC09_9HYPH|nr:DUF2948 family protein [Salinarimonas soli]KAA2235677.1 DUF2948 family protein [Salinarimonas soli]